MAVQDQTPNPDVKTDVEVEARSTISPKDFTRGNIKCDKCGSPTRNGYWKLASGFRLMFSLDTMKMKSRFEKQKRVPGYVQQRTITLFFSNTGHYLGSRSGS